METRTASTDLGPAEPASAVRAHLRLVAVVAVAVVCSALAVLFTRPVTYQSTASVLVNPIVLPGATPQPVDMATEKAIVSSDAVLSIASVRLGLSVDDLLESVSVDVPVDTRILEITAAAGTPLAARRRAGAIANAYVSYRSQVSEEAAASAGPTTPAPASPQAAPPASSDAAQIVSPAAVPTDPARPDLLVVLAASLVVGLGLGVGAALLRDRFDPSIRDVADFAATSGLPVLATVPNLVPRRLGRASSGTVPLASSRGADAYRLLQARTTSLLDGDHSTVLVVTSSAQQEVVRTVAANLAVAAARARRRVVLLTPEAGSGASLDPVPDSAGFLVAGALPPGPDAAGVLLARATESADLVVVDAPPLLDGPDPQDLVRLVDAILLVEQAGTSVPGRIRAGLALLAEIPDVVLAGVLVEHRKRRVRTDLGSGMNGTTAGQADADVRHRPSVASWLHAARTSLSLQRSD